MRLVLRLLWVWPTTGVQWLGIQARRAVNWAECDACRSRRALLRAPGGPRKYLDALRGGK